MRSCDIRFVRVSIKAQGGNSTLGGCTKVARGLVVEVVCVQEAAMCEGAVVVEYLWKHMKYNF